MLYFSRAHPNLAAVIPVMNRISSQLKTDAVNAGYSLPIHAAIKTGKVLLDKYYALVMDESEVYRISTSMYLPS